MPDETATMDGNREKTRRMEDVAGSAQFVETDRQVSKQVSFPSPDMRCRLPAAGLCKYAFAYNANVSGSNASVTFGLSVT
ncbi:hypothetical protein KIN20_020606 [Parelaphostrongylus tenuis]|uniref:Uncharacterized protein n=1 Tax=Parelaphostrongylus tenuis TaxID=148309 RepID=A0AAD5QVN2_PARTN|nr:hypothetical protein KIN20_020606 [Parelaphostrongylus tenuis]